MSRNRFARSVAVSLGAIVAVFAVLLTHCSTNTTPSTDTGMRPTALAAGGGPGACVPSSNPNNPVICVAAGGGADPESLTMNNNDHGVGNPIIWRSTTGADLALNLSCDQIETPSCHGPICIARTNPASSGQCSYTATVGGLTGSDPIIVTDNCCPSPFPMPRPRH